MEPSKPKSYNSVTAWVTLCALLTFGLSAPVITQPLAHAAVEGKNLLVATGTYDDENAPPSKYITKVTETRTTANLNLRAKASTSSTSYGVMTKGTVVKLTGKKSGSWSQLTWGSKTGWAASQFLETRTYTKDLSVRYMTSFTQIFAEPNFNRAVGGVNFRTQVSLLNVSGSWSQIKTAYYYGWVPSSKVTKARPAKAYRYVAKSSSVYSHQDKSNSKVVGRIHHSEKYEYRRWDSANRRDEILVGGRWVWSPVTQKPYVAREYRYAQETGSTYNRADKSSDTKVGTITRGTKVRWGAWSSANRRDEILLNGRWVWTGVTDRTKPAGTIPETISVSPYGRFAAKNAPLRKTPRSDPYDSILVTLKKGDKVTITGKADGGWVRVKYGNYTGYVNESYDLRRDGPYSVAVYGTLRTGQSAYNLMAGFQQKIMNQRFASSSLYQLWNPNWTFLTNGGGTVVNEQFQYSDTRGSNMLQKLDVYESQLKYNGKPMYTRQKVRMTDGSESWTYKTTSESEKVVKNSGRYISSGDFLQRS
ncbi:SH3 domain-containing protein [Arthrobacter sp. MYb213]|uniref:SH3 domain-containing protein n=1 Tax=Arthrobacter sp. MYb213 TaxID=1848595 RepID=UPI0015E465FA|nr:SH3 domain-containing protein [Arthrobacter sp. MYb213]